MTKIQYKKVGEDYEKKDPVKRLAQVQAALTSKNIHPFKEISNTRGESAYVWDQNGILMASVIEGLGTKNLIAAQMELLTSNNYYDRIAYDTVAAIVNDLATTGARPLVVHAFWATGNANWVSNNSRIASLITGWKKACDDSMASWGGGESPTLKDSVCDGSIVLGGSCVGIIGNKKRLISDNKIKLGDRIILIKSSGVNANGISLIRAVGKKLPKGYLTELSDGNCFGEVVLNKSNIYVRLIQDILDKGIDLHYISNITGHGLRKIMRSNRNFSYKIERIFNPSEEFLLIQKTAQLTDHEMYATLNMGMDYALFVSGEEVAKTLSVIKANNFDAIDAGCVCRGPRKVEVVPLGIEYEGGSLTLK